MTVFWIVLGVLALGGALIVVRALSKVAAAAKDLQKNVAILSQHVTSSIQHMGGDVQALGDSVDELRRRSSEAAPDGAAPLPERTEGG